MADAWYPSATINNCPPCVPYGGSHQFTLYWTGGWSAQPGTWAIVSGGGTINSSGLYTAPGSGTGESVVISFTPTDANQPGSRVAFCLVTTVRTINVAAGDIAGVSLTANVNTGAGAVDHTTNFQAYLNAQGNQQNSYLRILIDGNGLTNTALAVTHIDLPAYTCLDLRNAGGIYFMPESSPNRKPRIFNKNPQGATTHVVITNDKHLGITGDLTGLINFNSEAYPVGSDTTQGWCSGVAFGGVFAPFVEKCGMIKARCFTNHIWNTDYARVQDAVTDQNFASYTYGDAVHFNGPDNWPLVYNVTGKAGDDCFAWNASDPTTGFTNNTSYNWSGFLSYANGGMGPITNARQIRCQTLPNNLYGARLLTFDTGCTIDIVVDEFFMQATGYGLNNDLFNSAQRPNPVATVTAKIWRLSGICHTIKTGTGSNANRPCVFWTSDAGTFDFRGVRAFTASGYPLIYTGDNSTATVNVDGDVAVIPSTVQTSCRFYCKRGTINISNSNHVSNELSVEPWFVFDSSTAAAMVMSANNNVVSGYPQAIGRNYSGSSFTATVSGSGNVLNNSGNITGVNKVVSSSGGITGTCTWTGDASSLSQVMSETFTQADGPLAGKTTDVGGLVWADQAGNPAITSNQMTLGTATTGVLGGANNTNSAGKLVYDAAVKTAIFEGQSITASATSPNDSALMINAVDNNNAYGVFGMHHSSRAIGFGARVSGTTTYLLSQANAINANPTTYNFVVLKDDYGKFRVYNRTSIDRGYTYSSTAGAGLTATQKHTVFYVFGGGSNIALDGLKISTLTPATSDTTAPTLVNAQILSDGVTTILTFSEPLDPAHTTGLDLRVNGLSRAYSGATISADTLTVTLTATVYLGGSFTVNYAPGTIRDVAGNLLASFSGFVGYNLSTQLGLVDTVPPTLTSKTINSAGDQIVLVTNETTVNGTNGWTVKVAGTAGGPVVIPVTWARTNGTTLTGTLGQTVYAGQAVTVSYSQATGDLLDNSGNELADLTDAAVTNGSTQTDATLPTITGAVLAADGVTLSLTISEASVGGLGFTVNVEGVAVSHTPYRTNWNTITLILTSPIAAGKVVTLDYAQAPGDVLDLSGNELAAITGMAVTNNSAVADSGINWQVRRNGQAALLRSL